MERKPSAKKPLIMAGILTLALVAFFAGGIVLSSAHAASKGKPGQPGTPGPAKGAKGTATVKRGQRYCDSQQRCRKHHQGHGPGLLPNVTKNSAVTIITTASTIYDPDQSVVAPGKTISVVVTVNQDGGITASKIGFYDPTIGDVSGTITKIDGSTITVQAEDKTFTILVMDSTTFSKGQYDLQTHTKSSQPASFSDLAVGETIKAEGKLNSDGSLTASNVVIMPSGVGTKVPSNVGK